MYDNTCYYVSEYNKTGKLSLDLLRQTVEADARNFSVCFSNRYFSVYDCRGVKLTTYLNGEKLNTTPDHLELWMGWGFFGILK